LSQVVWALPAKSRGGCGHWWARTSFSPGVTRDNHHNDNDDDNDNNDDDDTNDDNDNNEDHGNDDNGDDDHSIQICGDSPSARRKEEEEASYLDQEEE